MLGDDAEDGDADEAKLKHFETGVSEGSKSELDSGTRYMLVSNISSNDSLTASPEHITNKWNIKRVILN